MSTWDSFRLEWLERWSKSMTPRLSTSSFTPKSFRLAFELWTEEQSSRKQWPLLSFRRFCSMMAVWTTFARQPRDSSLWARFWIPWSSHSKRNPRIDFWSISLGVIRDFRRTRRLKKRFRRDLPSLSRKKAFWESKMSTRESTSKLWRSTWRSQLPVFLSLCQQDKGKGVS